MPRRTVHDDLQVLARLDNAGQPASELKPLCLGLIDRVAVWASEVQGEIPSDVLTKLMAAMRAAGREDVATVIAEVEQVLALLETSARGVAAARPPPPGPRRGEAATRSAKADARKASTVAEALDPLLARLRAKRKG